MKPAQKRAVAQSSGSAFGSASGGPAGSRASRARAAATAASRGTRRRCGLRLRDLAAARVRYGYRRLHVLLRREGWRVNHKRVYRLYREEGLGIRVKRRKKRVSVPRVVPAAGTPTAGALEHGFPEPTAWPTGAASGS